MFLETTKTNDVNKQQSRRFRDRFWQTRLAELVWMPRVSGRDLDSETKIGKKSSKTLLDCPILAFRNSCIVVFFKYSVA